MIDGTWQRKRASVYLSLCFDQGNSYSPRETRREVFYILDPCLTAEQRNGRCQQYATTRNEKQPDSQSVKQQQGHKGKNK